ncbi:MAG TPA: long-chain-acyl-CoA synthetase [Gammaproteobacteria bacterium]|nr:long-chain-acyl-CoA synthetase [Gammaproteobacteria bacterium]
MSEGQVITLPMVLKQVPSVLARVPNVVRAGAILNPLNKNLSLGWAIANAAKKHPNNPAIYYEDRMLTYKQLNEAANQVANCLKAQGVTRGDVVALFMQNRPEFLIHAIGIAKLGAVASLINNSQTGKVLTHSINLVKPVAALIGDELLETINEIRDQLELPADKFFNVFDGDVTESAGPEIDGYTNFWSLAKDASKQNPAETNAVQKSDHLFYIYTSGTTGMPKASITNHERWLAAHVGVGHVIAGIKSSDCFYLTLPLYHATGLLVCWGGVVAGGGSIVIRRKFSASEFWNDIRKYNCTGFGYVGELCRYLLNVPPKPDDAQNPVKKIIGNGLRPNIWKEFRNRFSIDNIYEFYAASEGNVAFFNVFNLDETCGFGAGNISIIKYDKEKDEPVKNSKGFYVKAGVGEPGLLIGKVTKATPFVGYTQKDKTESALLRNVFQEGDCYFNTGDLIRNVGCAHYQFVDRLGDTFRWKGENVSTTELENIISDYPDISETVVYGVEIPNTNGRAGMASITPADGKQIDFKGLYEYLAKELPHYAVPVFLRIKDSMATTGTFKYQKSDLKKESFDPGAVTEPLYVLLPKGSEYVPLTQDIFSKINQNEYRF